MRIAVISSICGMLVHSIFDFNLHILSNMLLFAVVLGMLSSLSISSEEKYHKRSDQRNASENVKEQDAENTDPATATPDKVEDWKKEIKNS